MGRNTKKKKNKSKAETPEVPKAPEKLEIGVLVAIGIAFFLFATIVLLLLHSAEIDLITGLDNFLIVIGTISFAWQLLDVHFPKPHLIKKRSSNNVILAISIAIVLASLTARFLYGQGIYLEFHHKEPTEAPQEEPMPESADAGMADVPTRESVINEPEEPLESPYQDISADANTELLEPQTVISNAEALTEETALVLQEGPEHLLDIIDPALKSVLPPPAAKNKGDWEPRLSDTIKETVNSDSQPSNNEINGNGSFGTLTSHANQLEDEMSGLDAEKLFEIIDCREKAFEIFETKGLRLLLSNDYHKAARYYRLNADWENAYSYYVKSIEYKMRHIRTLAKMDSEYFGDLYEIAILYHCIGDMPTIPEEYRTEAYFLSTCLMEVVSKNTSGEEAPERGFLSSYYAGMINHKQALLGLRSRADGTDIFINDGFRYYERSLDFDDYKRQRNYQYEYLADLCQCALNYYKWRWSPVLEDRAIYEQRKVEYLDKTV